MKTINSIPHFGDKSEDVKTIQQILAEKGIANLTIDGIFGNQTLKALKKLQEKEGLVIDGIIGKNTMRVMEVELRKCIDHSGKVTLSWDRQGIDRNWTEITLKSIEELFDTSFSKCDDISDFRKDYYSLSKEQRIIVWGELICAMAKFESNWKTICRYQETTQGIDSVTKRPVYSEGLLQLSYQDKPNYHFLQCDFNWEQDKNLKDNDPAKTIFNAQYNLEFGIRILAYQIRRKNSIALSSGLYWAVLKKAGERISQIAAMVNNLNF